LVYAHDADAGHKHKIAVKEVAALWDRQYPPAISSQVLQELYVSLAKKGASMADCRRIVGIYLDWEIINHDTQLVLAAIEIRERFKLSLWDSLIVAAAHEAKASILWSEEMQAGRRFDNLVVLNPFGDDSN
jgi:predicted nucleic acid-binding protein